MPPHAPAPSHRWPKFIRIIRARPRLFLSALLGLIAIVALPAEWRMPTRLVAGWDIGVGLYLILALQLMARSDIAGIRRRAMLQDEGQFVILILTIAAALASLGAIIAELGASAGGGERPPGHLVLAIVTILLSWAFIHV